MFGIASNTKVFTAAALGTLVDEGKLKRDGRVIDVLPSFRLADPFVTQEMTIRDLLVHRSGLGLGAGDLLGGRPQPTTGTRSSSGSRAFRWPPASAAPTPTTTCCI